MRKIRITSTNLKDLRNFLSGTDLDLGCRPAARKRDGRFETFAYGERGEFDRLRASRTNGVEVENLGDLAPATTRQQMTGTGNRFIGGQVPRGFGKKE